MTTWRWLRRHPLIYYWLPLVAWMGLIFTLSAQSDLPHPNRGWVDLLVSSTAHVILFAVLAVLWARAMRARAMRAHAMRAHAMRAHPRRWLLAFLLTLVYALSDEIHQGFVPGRTPDPLDLLCDGAGAALGLWGWSRRERVPDPTSPERASGPGSSLAADNEDITE